MTISKDRLHADLDALAARVPEIGAVIAAKGYPEPRCRDPGYETLLRTIVGQQVSVKAAAAIWTRVAEALGEPTSPDAALALSVEELRAAGLSRQKASYVHSLAEHCADGRLDLHALPAEDEAAIAKLVDVKGIGRWSAEVYLLFAEGRCDIWPAGDLAVRIALGEVLGLKDRPTEGETRKLTEAWSPYRGAAAILMWHHYNTEVF
ncbi:MAG: DNA-3-methyladenine glycosylase 2 family protein [Pacificimonas sp.]